MMQPVYILSSCAISPQQSFEASGFLRPVKSTGDGKLFAVDADYRQFIGPVAIRRMSRLIKMGISTGIRALQLAGIEKPDAIITGTGMGSMTDTEHFLKDMIALNEEALNPTCFIQSTYNSINGWIALQSKCTGYNQTFVNRGLSLELSLLDAQMLLNEGSGVRVVLAGCFDELTPDYFIVKSKCHYWKKDIPDSRDLLKHSNTPGTIAGEGVAFFTVSNDPAHAVCSLQAIKMIQYPDAESIHRQVTDFLASRDTGFDRIDVVIAGMSGDAAFQPLYDAVLNNIPDNVTIAAFKHLSGEYPTASGFALWLATRIFSESHIPPEVVYREGTGRPVRNILILNHYILDSCSLILLSADH